MPLIEAIRNAGARPVEGRRADKKNYSEELSKQVALALAGRFRELGLKDCRPDDHGGTERQFAGGIGAKKVDVSYATEEDGLILGISVKSIGFADPRTGNYQKNLTNRRGDLLAEATTLHQRFPFAVLGGLFLLHEGAKRDGTARRASTFHTTHEYLRSFDNRDSRTNAVEKFEVLGIVLYRPERALSYKYFDVGQPDKPSSLDRFFHRLLTRVADRNPDHFRYADGRLLPRSRGAVE